MVGAEVLEVSADLANAAEAKELSDLAVKVEHVESIKGGPDRAAAATAWKQADVDRG